LIGFGDYLMSESSSDDGMSVEEDQSRKTFESDLGYVAAFDTTPVDPEAINSSSCDAHLRRLASENIKLIFRDLVNLPKAEAGTTLVTLPDTSFRLPRWKPIPKEKGETKWEKFAKEKGIDNRKKRDRMLWNDDTQTWAPRYGYGKHVEGGEQAEWCIELDDADDNNVDKFKQRKETKKLRVLKNRAKYLKNQERNSDKTVMDSIENLNVEGSRTGASKRGMGKINSALKTVQVATASMGRFDQVLQGEPKRPRLGNKKQKFAPSETVSELDRDKKILSRLLGKHLGGTTKSPAKEAGGRKKKGGRR